MCSRRRETAPRPLSLLASTPTAELTLSQHPSRNGLLFVRASPSARYTTVKKARNRRRRVRSLTVRQSKISAGRQRRTWGA